MTMTTSATRRIRAIGAVLAALGASTAMASIPTAAIAQSRAAIGSVPKVGDFIGQQAYGADGGQAGTIGGVYVSATGQYYAVVDFGKDLGARRVPISRFQFVENRLTMSGLGKDEFAALEKGDSGLTLVAEDTPISILGFTAAARGEGAVQVQQLAAQVRVQQAPLTIQVEQPAAQVSVRQPTPQVSVRQLQPVVIVRQPPPIVTVTVPEPEIIVRLPEPEVNVAMAEPEIQINVPEPQVQIVEQQQPQIAVQSAQPVVSLLPRGQAEVAIQQAQPQVQFERLGEPQIVVNKSEGKPNVRFERLTTAEALDLNPLLQPLRPMIATEIQQPALLASLEAGSTVAAAELKGRQVIDPLGKTMGVVDGIVLDGSGKHFFVVDYDKAVGVGSRRVLLPGDSFTLRGDALAVPGMSLEEIKGQKAWNEDMTGLKPVASDGVIPIVAVQ